MTVIEGIILVFAGAFAGFVNSIAGGGSLVIMPLLIFMGLPSAEANGSNRVAIFIQNIFSVAGYRSKGVYVFPFAIYMAIPAIFGAIINTLRKAGRDSEESIDVDVEDERILRSGVRTLGSGVRFLGSGVHGGAVPFGERP